MRLRLATRQLWQKLNTCDRASLFGWLCVVAIATIYTLIYFNRFMPPQEGWFNAFSRRLLAGEIPYRDFRLFLQPIYPYLLSALNGIFGFDFLVFRVYGIFERVLLASLVYIICRRMFKPWISAFATVASLALYWSFNADAVYSYYQLSLAFVLLSLWLLLKFFREKVETKRLFYVTMAGICCSVSFMTKQTLGLAFPLLALALIVLESLRTKGGGVKLGKTIALFSAGYASVVAMFSVFFLLTHSFDEYISQVYFGVSSKGSVTSMLFGSIEIILSSHLNRTILFAIALVGLPSIYMAVSHRLRRKGQPSAVSSCGEDRCAWIAVIVLSLLTLVLPCFLLSSLETTQLAGANLFDVKRSFVYALFIVSMVLAIAYLGKTVFQSTSHITGLAIAATSFTIMYVHGLSGVIEEHSTALAFGFLIGLALSHEGIMKTAKQVAVILLVAALMLICSVQKMTWPYGWWGWYEPSIRQATTTADVPNMWGLYMSDNTASMYETVYHSLEGEIGGDEYLYTFPHIKAFDNIFANVPPTFADVHYFDVCDDTTAIADSEVLRANPPKAIVYMDLTEETWSKHEELFRDGQPSGQREIERFIDEGIRSGQYRILNEIAASEGAVILVLLRTN